MMMVQQAFTASVALDAMGVRDAEVVIQLVKKKIIIL